MANRTVKIDQRNTFRIKTILDEDTHVTTCEVSTLDLFGDPIVIGRGKARWNPIDYFDPEIGEGIALGRALAKYGKKLAAFWQKQSGSVGEHRAQVQKKRNIQELGEVYSHMLSAVYPKPKPEKPKFPNTPHDEHGPWCEPCPYLESLQNAPQESTKASDAVEKVYEYEGATNLLAMLTTPDTVEDLDTVIETNRAKLENKGG